MSFATVLAGVLAVGQGATGFSSSNFTYEDYQPLNAGVDNAVVVEYSRFTTEESAFGGDDWYDWVFRLKLHTFSGDVTAAATARDTARAAIISQFRKYPRLNNVTGVFLSKIMSGERADEPIKLGDASFTLETFELKVREEQTPEAVE